MHATRSNRLLDALSCDCREAILAVSNEMDLPIRASLQSQEAIPKYAYFITSGIASVVVGLAEGGSAETALIGREGLTGAMSLLGNALPSTECFIQVPASAYRIPLTALKDLFMSSEEIRSRILEFVQEQSMTTSQIAGCNKLHDAEARLARWLLMVQDRTQEDSFLLTQEFLAEMLGTRRTTVALVAGTLQRGGFIEYSRGKITIKSRRDLQTVACDCYPVTQRLLDGLYS